MPAPAIVRSKVLWFGPHPQSEVLDECKHRHLKLDINNQNPLKEFRFARAIVFKYNSQKPGRLQLDMNRYAALGADHGLKVIAVADDHTGQNVISHAVVNLKLPFSVISKTAPSAHELAEEAARHQPGVFEFPDLKISGTGLEKLSDSDLLLFRRAFWDCGEIILDVLHGGRSAHVFTVYATFLDSGAGPRPLPFFAKLDRKMKILRELDNYAEFSEHHIPFSSRPNLDRSRCIIGSCKGLIVGNFVERSETLWDIAIRGHANSALFSLFEEAMRGWRLQAYQSAYSPVSTNSLYRELRTFVKPQRLPDPLWLKAQELGATISPLGILGLLKALPGVSHRYGPIHGDLHSKNVRVRDSDAILIDFASTRRGPVLADFASLEVDLAFAVNKNEADDDVTWKALIDKLYQLDYLRKAPPPADQPLPREWLWNCVRQIRLFAFSMQISDLEYKTVLAMYLLRYAAFGADTQLEEYRRAYAYVVAERLLTT